MARSENGALSNQITMVGEGTVLEGTLRAQGDVRVSGRIVGALHAEGRAILSQGGFIEGEVLATDADVAGRVKGDLYVEKRLVLKSNARVEGDVEAGHLVVEEGALFTGQCRMGEAAREGVLGSATAHSDAEEADETETDEDEREAASAALDLDEQPLNGDRQPAEQP